MTLKPIMIVYAWANFVWTHSSRNSLLTPVILARISICVSFWIEKSSQKHTNMYMHSTCGACKHTR